jgi:hypothetical protein
MPSEEDIDGSEEDNVTNEKAIEVVVIQHQSNVQSDVLSSCSERGSFKDDIKDIDIDKSKEGSFDGFQDNVPNEVVIIQLQSNGQSDVLSSCSEQVTYVEETNVDCNSHRDLGGNCSSEDDRDKRVIHDTVSNDIANTVVVGFFQQATEAFNWDDFFFALIFGLIPSVLDIKSDYYFASQIIKSQVTAGLSYAIISMPLFSFLFLTIGNHSGQLMHFALLCFAGLFLLAGLSILLFYPAALNLLFYPAALVSFCILSTKSVAVFVHTPWVKQLSMMVSGTEGTFEWSNQLLLMLLSWLAGGRLHIVPIITSLFMMGKTRAEKQLASRMDYQMHEKSFREKVVLVLSLLPTFSLAAVFRLGSIALVLTRLQDFPSPVVGFCAFQFFFFLFGILLFVLFRMVSGWQPGLAQLTAVEAAQGLIGWQPVIPPIPITSPRARYGRL